MMFSRKWYDDAVNLREDCGIVAVIRFSHFGGMMVV